MKNVRLAAIQAMLAVEGGLHAQQALAQAVRGLTKSDIGLCTDLVYGALRSRTLLRQVLAKALPKWDKLPVFMRIALELGAYSIYFQDRIPGYAAVNETVGLVKKKFGQKMANVANAALRKLDRHHNMPLKKETAREKNDSDINHAEHGLPEELISLWVQAYGAENAASLAARSAKRPYGALRLNPLACESKNLESELAKAPEAIKTGPSGFAFPPGKTPKFINGHSIAFWLDKGVISRQAAGSQLVLEKLELVSAWQNVPIWDACAGFGGKSAFLLEQGLNVNLVSDKSIKRLSRLPGEIERLHLQLPALAVCDAARAPLQKWEGHILADVPCSGLGVLGRRPDLRLRWNISETAALVRLQTAILENLCNMLHPGRELAYITCTLNPAENDGQIDSLLARRKDMTLVGSWQTPHTHPWLEGMYGARLMKLP